MARFINFSSYNLHGFQQGKPQLLELCNSHDKIAVQEHWLADFDLDRIVQLRSDYTVVAASAMTEKNSIRLSAWASVWGIGRDGKELGL